MGEMLTNIATNLPWWIVVCAGSLTYLLLVAKISEPWRASTMKLFDDPMVFRPISEMRKISKVLEERPDDFIDLPSIAATLFFLISLMLVIAAILLRNFGY